MDDSKPGRPRGLSRLGKGIVGFLVIWCLVETAYFAHRSPGIQFPALAFFPLLFVAVVVAIVEAIDQWRQRRCGAIIPLLCCPLVVAIWWVAVPIARRAVFAWAFPSYESIVRQMEAGTIPVPDSLAEVPEAQAVSRMTHAVRARRAAVGQLTVEFHTEGGFPALHSGYLYCSWCATTTDAGRQVAWPIDAQVKEHWFSFSN